MRKLATYAISGLSVVACCLATAIPAASAATKTATPPAPVANPNAGQALEIAPPVMTLSANPGQVIKTQISIRDISSSNLLVKGQVNDFVAAGEDGTPKILMDSNDVDPYSIKGWVAPIADMVLVPKQIKNLPVTINVPADASPGGHYGVIRFTATPPDVKGSGVSLSASLGSLMLINVSGNVKEGLETASFTVSHGDKTGSMFESGPLTFTQRIKNTGNTHEQPIGQVVVKNMFGKTVGATNVNQPPRNILPASIRKFSQPFDSTVIGNKKLFGRYTAEMTLTYGAKKQTLTSTVSFWIIPWRLIIGAVIVLIAAFFVFRFLLQRYNRRIISKANRRR